MMITDNMLYTRNICHTTLWQLLIIKRNQDCSSSIMLCILDHVQYIWNYIIKTTVQCIIYDKRATRYKYQT